MPWAALLFWWDAIGYQVRVEGAVAETSDAESDDYFRRRPRGSQLSAWASEQGMVVGCRADLEARMAHVAARYQGRDVPRPPHWGGYRVTPQVMEFWRRRDDRLHERARYRRNGAYWLSEVLAP